MLLFPSKGARDRVDSKPRFLLFLFYFKNMDTIQHQFHPLSLLPVEMGRVLITPEGLSTF